MNIRLAQCTLNDLNALQKISYQTFDETFRSTNSDETMDAFLSAAFNHDKLKTELQILNSEFYFIYYGDNLSGYLKINFAPDQSDVNDEESLEVERIYILKEFAGKGLGKHLINFSIEKAVKNSKKYIWLGVWEYNYPAQEFYKKLGFEFIGKHPFVMGDEVQTDLIMKLTISPR